MLTSPFTHTTRPGAAVGACGRVRVCVRVRLGHPGGVRVRVRVRLVRPGGVRVRVRVRLARPPVGLVRVRILLRFRRKYRRCPNTAPSRRPRRCPCASERPSICTRSWRKFEDRTCARSEMPM